LIFKMVCITTEPRPEQIQCRIMEVKKGVERFFSVDGKITDFDDVASALRYANDNKAYALGQNIEKLRIVHYICGCLGPAEKEIELRGAA